MLDVSTLIRKHLSSCALAGVALVTVACGGSGGTPASTAPATHALHVALGPFQGGEGCDQVKSGQVTVTNESGTIIGTATPTDYQESKFGTLISGCSESFEVTVPAAKFYTIHFGTLTSRAYSSAELATARWSVSISAMKDLSG